MGLSPIMVDKIFEVVQRCLRPGRDRAAGGAKRQPCAGHRRPWLCDGVRRVITMTGDAKDHARQTPKVRAAYLGE